VIFGSALTDEESNSSVTLLKLNSLWHFSQSLPQQALGVENIEKDMKECPQ
jgi:hypothetical protein